MRAARCHSPTPCRSLLQSWNRLDHGEHADWRQHQHGHRGETLGGYDAAGNRLYGERESRRQAHSARRNKSPGQNEDGFYQFNATDAVDPNPRIFVVDSGTGTVFGPYPSGTNIKYMQAPGATPSASPMAGAVAWMIKGQATCRFTPSTAPATSRTTCPAWFRRRRSRATLRAQPARAGLLLPEFNGALRRPTQ